MTISEYPEFKGELYSYDYAEKRCPEAWARIDNGWNRLERKNVSVKGLGHFERQITDGRLTWIYVQPNGYSRPVSENWNKPNPPPLPRPGPWKKCGCGKVHNCSACGQPYWIEIHGVADGYCAYCYNAG